MNSKQYYKKCNVILTETNIKSPLRTVRGYDSNPLVCDFFMDATQSHNNRNSTINYNNLHIVSDEKINEDEFGITEEKKVVKFREYKKDESGYDYYVHDSLGFKYYTKSCKKIIATTDKSLGLPEPSKDFLKIYIEEYSKGKQIRDVLVKYEEDSKTLERSSGYLGFRCDTCGKWSYIINGNGKQCHCSHLNIDSNNTVSIKPQKYSWNIEELPIKEIVGLVKTITDDNFKGRYLGKIEKEYLDIVNKWIKDNL